MQRNATQRNAAQRSAAQRSAAQRSAAQRSAAQRNATQRNAITFISPQMETHMAKYIIIYTFVGFVTFATTYI